MSACDEQLRNVARLAALGLAVFPVDHPALPRCVGRHHPEAPCDGTRGKHPVPRSWPKESTTDLTDLRRRFGHGHRNLGIDCGRSALLILDEDRLGELERAAGDLDAPVPATFAVATGKGRHWWFRQPEGLPFTNRVGRFSGYSIDVRGRGGYVIGPGSTHQTGRRYTVLDWAAPILPVPGWVADALTWSPPAPPRRAHQLPDDRGTAKAVAGVLRVVLAATPGRRNGALYWASCRLWERVRDGRLPAAAGEAMLLDAAAAVGLGCSEARATVTSARKGVLGG